MCILDYSNQVSAQLEQDLQVLTLDSENKLIQFESAFHLVDQALKNVKRYLKDYHFVSEEEEVTFFKETMTELLKESVLYSELFKMESVRMPGSPKEQKRFFESELRTMRMFIQVNQEYYNYLLLRKTNQDRVFFLRNAQAPIYKPNLFWHTLDTRFCTVHTLYFARIKGTLVLMDYMHNQLSALDGKQTSQGVNQSTLIQWTGKKVDLVELIYALKQAGVLNNGRAGIKHIARYFEQIFEVNLQDLYRTYSEITIRKKSRTSFLDFLKFRMEDYLEQGESIK